MSDLLTVENLEIGFYTKLGLQRAIDRVSFSIKKGETFALVGESGCGKSITALAIARLLPSASCLGSNSKISLAGQDLLALSEVDMRLIRGRRIAMIFQEPMTAFNPVLTIEQQIKEILTYHFNYTKDTAYKKTLELLNDVGLANAEHWLTAYPHQLSGGMRQRVMIAMALAGEPELLIADEPTTAIDVTLQKQILKLLKSLQNKYQMGLLLITHDLNVVKTMANQVAVMYAGQIIEQSDAEIFFAEPKHPYSKQLFNALPSLEKRDKALEVIPGFVPLLTQTFTVCRFAARCHNAWSTCHQIKPLWLALQTNHFVRCHLYDEAQSQPKEQSAELSDLMKASTKQRQHERFIMKVEDIKVHFPIKKGVLRRQVGFVKAVDGVSFELQQGKTLALVGESGSGKTTLGKAIMQLLPITEGKVSFNQNEVTALSSTALRQFRADVQFIFQDPFSSMNPRMLVEEVLLEGVLAHKKMLEKQQQHVLLKKLLGQVGLPEQSLLRYPHEFSGGQRQRLAIARALAVNPKLIICDEPTSALDVSVQAQILNLLKKLQIELGLSYLFITHDLAVVSYIADEVAVMKSGKIIEQGDVASVLKNPRHEYTQKLLSAVIS